MVVAVESVIEESIPKVGFFSVFGAMFLKCQRILLMKVILFDLHGFKRF